MVREQAPYQEPINQDFDIIVRKPVVKGNRISVERVLAHSDQKDRVGLFVAFPELIEDGGKACLVYACATVQRQHRRLPTVRHDLLFRSTGRRVNVFVDGVTLPDKSRPLPYETRTDLFNIGFISLQLHEIRSAVSIAGCRVP